MGKGFILTVQDAAYLRGPEGRDLSRSLHKQCAQLDLSTLMECRKPCLGNGATHSGLVLPTSTNAFTQTTPTGKSNKDVSSTRLSSQIILECLI